MILVPTSLDTAIVLELQPSLFWEAAGYALLLLGAYCLWEMLLSMLFGRQPAPSRWILLATAVLLMAASAVLFEQMLAPVTFNDGAVSTAWNFVLGELLGVAVMLCVLALVVLRALDALKAGSIGSLPVIVWWLLGAAVVSSYGLLIAWSSQLGNAGWDGTVAVLVGGTVLAVGGLGSLLGVAAIRVRRSRTT